MITRGRVQCDKAIRQRLADSQRRGGRRRWRVEHVQHVRPRLDNEIVDQPAVGPHGLRSDSAAPAKNVVVPEGRHERLQRLEKTPTAQ